MKTKIYRFDDEKSPNISLLDKRLVWWNEDYYCMRLKE